MLFLHTHRKEEKKKSKNLSFAGFWMKSVISKILIKKKPQTLNLVHMSKPSLRSTLRCTVPKKSALRAKHTVKQHLGTWGNWFSNQLEYQRSLVFASETKILSIVIYCRGHSLVF